jgi:hypothetical protein
LIQEDGHLTAGLTIEVRAYRPRREALWVLAADLCKVSTGGDEGDGLPEKVAFVSFLNRKTSGAGTPGEVMFVEFVMSVAFVGAFSLSDSPAIYPHSDDHRPPPFMIS